MALDKIFMKAWINLIAVQMKSLSDFVFEIKDIWRGTFSDDGPA